MTPVRISKYKNILQKDMHQIGQKKFLLLIKLKIQFVGLMLLVTLMVKKNIGSFYEKELQKTSQEKFRIQKVLKRKGDKLHVKWKGYYNSFNSLIDKKDLIRV